MSRCTTVDQETLEKTKVDRALQRLSKRGDQEGKSTARKILENAATVTRQKNAQGNSSPAPGSVEPRVKSNGMIQPSLDKSRHPEKNVGVKQPQATALPTGQINQRPKTSATALGTSAAASSKPTTLKAKKLQSGKADPNLAAKPTSAPAAVPKIKTNHISAKPTNFFMSIQSASKRPGTSNAALSAKAKEAKDGYAILVSCHLYEFVMLIVW